MFVRINGETHYLWRAVDHEGEVLEVFATKRRDRTAALKFLKRTMKRHGRPRSVVTDRLRSYRAAMNVIGNAADQTCGRRVGGNPYEAAECACEGCARIMIDVADLIDPQMGQGERHDVGRFPLHGHP